MEAIIKILGWDDMQMSFIETRDIDRETTAEYKNRTLCSVSYSELRDNGLAGDIKDEIIQQGLEWLKRKIGIEK